MKFLKLDMTDYELYNIDGENKDVTYLYENMHSFKQMYNSQGEVFWLRHIMTFREYFYILIKARFELEENQCLHWIISPMEKIFIKIHKLMFINNGFDGMRESLKILKATFANLHAISYLIRTDKWKFINCHISNKIANKNMFGWHLGQSKVAAIKIYIASGLYTHFVRSLGVLLKRYKGASDMPANKKKQYWKPFPFWNENFKHEANSFETHLANFYKERLDEILLTPNLYEIFQHKSLHKCCVSFIKEQSTRILKNERSFKQKQYVACKQHVACYLRKVHSKKCANPYYECHPKSQCKVTCDTHVLEENYLKQKERTDCRVEFYWKNTDALIYESSKPNCKDVAISVEIDSDNPIQNYIPESLGISDVEDEECDDEDDDDDDSFLKPLPPIYRNLLKQREQKDKTIARLRDKLCKKTRSTNNDFVHCLIEEENFFDSLGLRALLFLKAQIHFREELGDEILLKVSEEKIGRSSAPLMDLLEGYFDPDDFCPRTNPSDSQNYRSIGVGSDIPLDWEFLSIIKYIHIQKRLQTNKMEIHEANNENKSKSIKPIEEETKEINSEKLTENSKTKKKKKKKKEKANDSEISKETLNVQNTFIKTSSVQCDLLHGKVNAINFGVDEFMENCDMLHMQMNALIQRTTSQMASTSIEKIDNAEIKNLTVNSKSVELNHPIREEIGQLVKDSFSHVFNTLNTMEAKNDNKNKNLKENQNLKKMQKNDSTKTKKKKSNDNLKDIKEEINCTCKDIKNEINDKPKDSNKEVVDSKDNNKEVNIDSKNSNKLVNLEPKDSKHKEKEFNNGSKTSKKEINNDFKNSKKEIINDFKNSKKEIINGSNDSKIEINDKFKYSKEVDDDSSENKEDDSNDSKIEINDKFKYSKEVNDDSSENKEDDSNDSKRANDDSNENKEDDSNKIKKEVNDDPKGSKTLVVTNSLENNGIYNDKLKESNEENHDEFKAIKNKIQSSLTELKERSLSPIQQIVSKIEKIESELNFICKEKSYTLRLCSNCNRQEPSRKSFKKCKLCKDHCFKLPRYYCSRECQTTDWINKHQAEHRNYNIQ